MRAFSRVFSKTIRTSAISAPSPRRAFPIARSVPPVEMTSSTKTTRSPLPIPLMNMSPFEYPVVCFRETSPGRPYRRFRTKTYGLWTRIDSPAASGNPIDSAVTILSQRFQSPIRTSSERTSSRTSGRPRGIPSVIGWTKYSYSPKRTIGDSARLARRRSRAISDPRHEIPCDPRGFFEDFRFASHPATPHQHDAIADRRVHDVPVGGVDPVADIIMSGRELRPPRIDEDDVREAVDTDEAGIDAEGPRTSEVRELERLDRRHDGRIVVRIFLQERCDLHRLEHVEVVVARRAVRPEAHDDRGLFHRGVRHRLPGRELHVRGRAVGHPRTGVMRSAFNASIRRFTSSAVRSCFAARSASFRSTMPSARNARRPISFTALAAASMWKYMSLKVVVPVLIISRHASLVPQYTSSGVSLASAGQIFVSSHVDSSRSSPQPRNRVIAACVCRFTKPGSAIFPFPSITVSASRFLPISAIRFPSMYTWVTSPSTCTSRMRMLIGFAPALSRRRCA